MFASLIAIVWNPDPYIFQIGSLSIKWYGLAFALGIPIAYFLFKYFIKREEKNDFSSIQIVEYGFIGCLIGARIGHIIFYEWAYYLENPLEVFQVWKGGLASHGAAVGLMASAMLLTRLKKKGSLWWLLDRAAIVICFCAGVVRIGNLFNSEIYGKATDVPWGFQFVQIDEIVRHPSQLYEAILVFVIGAFLLRVYRKKDLPKGLLVGLYFALAFGFRTILEFFKEDAIQTQMLNLPVVLAGIIILFFARKNTWGNYARAEITS